MNHVELLAAIFPVGSRWSDWNVEGLLKGLDTNLEREAKDGTIPNKWTDSELQWDPVCNALYEHVVQSGNESLAWVLLLLITDRCHGLWRISRNGLRNPLLDDAANWHRLMFAMRARLGVIDGWLRRNGSQPYSQAVFKAFSNAPLCFMSPKTPLWDHAATQQESFITRVLAVTRSPLNVGHVTLLTSALQTSLFCIEGQQELTRLDEIIATLPKKQRKEWVDVDPVALRTLVLPILEDLQFAEAINDAWKNIQWED